MTERWPTGLSTSMLENCYPGPQGQPDWARPEIRHIRRLPPHAHLIPFPDRAGCLEEQASHPREASPMIVSLRGDWGRRRYRSVEDLPDNILSYRSGFEPIEIPWLPSGAPAADRSAGYLLDWPAIKSDQPVTVLHRRCRLPVTWGSQRKRLTLLGVLQAFHLYINGRLAGYSEGGQCAEFDVTQFIHDGENDLFLLIWETATSSYLQRDNGMTAAAVFRDIYLEAVPPVTLYDLQVETKMDEDPQSWQLALDLHLLSYRISLDRPRLRISLYDGGNCLYDVRQSIDLRPIDRENNDWPSPVQAQARFQLETVIHGLDAWSDEHPVVYDLVIGVEDAQGRDLVCYRQMIGFRQLKKTRDGWQLNGRPFQLMAAVWHEAKIWETVPDIAAMVRHIRQLKRYQLNALLIRELPPDPIFLELCDVYGVYVIADIPVDPDPRIMAQISRDIQFHDYALDVCRRQIARDRLHACLLAWHVPMLAHHRMLPDHLTEAIRSLDPTRVWQDFDFSDPEAPVLHWRGQMPPADELIPSWLRQPRTVTDFAIALGHWLPPQSAGENEWPLLIAGDHPGALLKALRHVLRPVSIEAVNAANGAFILHNHQYSQTSETCKISWVLLRDGRFELAGELDLQRVEPGGEQFFELWYGEDGLSQKAAYRVRFEIRRAEQTLWCGYGEAITQEEFLISQPDREPDAPRRKSYLRLDQDRHQLIVSGSRFWFVFNTIRGCLESWRIGESELIEQSGLTTGLRPRLITQPDHLSLPWLPLWQEHGLLNPVAQIIAVQHQADAQQAVVTVREHVGPAGGLPYFDLYTRYEIDAAGSLRVYLSLSLLESGNDWTWPIPGIGLDYPVSAACTQLSWQGRGPEPGLAGLRQDAVYGQYQSEIDRMDQTEGLVYGECHRLSCDMEQGPGLSINSDLPFYWRLDSQPGSTRSTGRRFTRICCLPAEYRVVNPPLKALFELKPVTGGW
ncbi:MAG: glycoside hydrolase family 2 TIM barrel-domain containing protein [Eubacteriales bacterium]|nr:glycoside hydrolase family 2 TIM barrel-domain containing protein [Eubacteriales bacterium]